MLNTLTFACPRCGAPVHVADGRFYTDCEYCGGTLLVPPDLRPTSAPPSHAQPTELNLALTELPAHDTRPLPALPVLPALSPPPTQTYVQKPARSHSRSLTAVQILLILLALVTAGVVWFINSRVPYLFENLTAGGYARLDQMFSAQEYGGEPLSDFADIAIDGIDNIYVGDEVRHRVARFSPEGTYVSSWQLADDADLPLAFVAMSSKGVLYANVGGKVQRYNASTGALLGTTTVPDGPLGNFCLLHDGSFLAYLQAGEDTLIRFDESGTEIGRFNKPVSEIVPTVPDTKLARLAVAKDDTIYLLAPNPTRAAVFVYTPEGRYIRHFGGSGDGEGEFNLASSIAIDGKGRIFVADSKGVQVFDATGKDIGIIRLPFSGDVRGMAFNSKNELYVASSHKIYKFVLNEP